jgi:hypothetical protein
MLKPELQSMDEYVDGVNNIVENQKRVAQMYFNDGSVEAAVEPLKALLHIMVYGEYKGMTLLSKEFRELFTRENMMESDWYKERLRNKHVNDIALWQGHQKYLLEFLKKAGNLDEEKQKEITDKLQMVSERLAFVQSQEYYDMLIGTIGKDNLYLG